MKKFSTRVASMALAGSMVFSGLGSASIFAQGPDVNYGEGNTIDVTKTVETDGKTMAPNTTFTFNVANGEAGSYDGNVVYAGVTGGLVGTTIAFSPTGTTPSDTYTGTGTLTTNASVFTRPGVYAYTVTEASSDYEGVTTDSSSYTVYLYVVNGTNGYEVSNVIAVKGNTKSESLTFTNDYGKSSDTTHDVTLTKTITGNQSVSTDTFSFDVLVNGASGEQYYVEYTTNNGTAATAVITSGTPTTLSGISHNDTIKINGLTASDTYSITEQENSDGYTVTYSNNTGNATADGTTATATNRKDASTPTGIFMTYMPYLAMVVLAGAFFIVSRRNHRREEI